MQLKQKDLQLNRHQHENVIKWEMYEYVRV